MEWIKRNKYPECLELGTWEKEPKWMQRVIVEYLGGEISDIIFWSGTRFKNKNGLEMFNINKWKPFIDENGEYVYHEEKKLFTNDENYFAYWNIEYISCEGNYRWTIARTPIDWSEYDVRNRIPMGGCGDDVSEVREVFQTSDTDYAWDFCD